MDKIYKVIVVLLVLIVLPTSCMVGPKYVRPEEPESASYRFQTIPSDTLASVTNLKWFELFNDTVLVNLITKRVR